ncbi:TIGR03943 family protein [Mycobacterium sp. ITM-2016-00316]|uniref:TIGR03943 family putative permease subunit n=1 Tax=Mycobacterium sp. ITM-2016-00316 TaxID=2099695 RepID=UPI000CF96E9A|nr:TIGR03943 family protein [Mycobacterium sp. ITM-2016-00316]WNG81508.1 TIGR03943 family protein [Mycobacterium sp. ITM-2016-00316]
MSRETENALLLLVGLSTAIIAFSGAFTRYVKPALLPWLWASAVVLIALALIAIVGDIRHGPRDREHAGHEHRSGVTWLLVIPVALLAFVVPPALGPQSARPAVSASAAERRPFPELPAGRAPELSLPEVLIRLAQDSAGTMNDRLLTVTGFTIRDGARTYLGRVVILCCAADAQLARIGLAGPGAATAAALPDGTWVRVEGRASAGELRAETVVQIPEPANTYSY